VFVQALQIAASVIPGTAFAVPSIEYMPTAILSIHILTIYSHLRQIMSKYVFTFFKTPKKINPFVVKSSLLYYNGDNHKKGR
jgi:hypothetical protein